MSTVREFTLLTPTEEPQSPNKPAGFIVCRDLGEDAGFRNLNFAHLQINAGKPVRGIRLGGIWMKDLEQMIYADSQDCFPDEWRAEGFILRGTEYLDAKGNLCVVKFVYRPDTGWRRTYIPVPEIHGNELIFRPTIAPV